MFVSTRLEPPVLNLGIISCVGTRVSHMFGRTFSHNLKDVWYLVQCFECVCSVLFVKILTLVLMANFTFQFLRDKTLIQK
jgi:hypothetical protein